MVEPVESHRGLRASPLSGIIFQAFMERIWCLFSKTSLFPSVSYTFTQKYLNFRIIFLHFYEVFLNMGLPGCQNSNFYGEDLIVSCVSSICKIWPVFIFFSQDLASIYFFMFFYAPGCFFMFFFRPGMFFSCFYSNHIIKSYYKIIL